MNYIGNHPLNLIGKIAIVTSASSQTGAAICRELLNSNANVLGIDSRPAHVTTTARKGSHFQFFQYEGNAAPSGKDVLEYTRGVYGRDGADVDFLVVVDGGREMKGVVGGVVDFMEKQNGGLIVDVLSGRDRGLETKVIEEIRTLHSRLKGKGVRCNVIVPHDISSESNGDSNLDIHTENALKEHVEAHMQRREKGGYAVEEERDLANLVLFLCTRLGADISGMVLGSGGHATPL